MTALFTKHLTRSTLGFHAEADFMSSCFPHSLLLRLPTLSSKITVIDYAAHAFGRSCPYPLFVDDEGVIARDACIIRNGRVVGCLTNREYAAKLQLPLTGNARIPRHGEPPQIYMRNTALLPGPDKVQDMIASIKDGYYLVDGKDPAGDPSGDFACRITEGYRIRNGVVCEPIHDYVVWGCGVAFLKSITMVGDDFEWFTDTFPDRPLAPQAFGAPSIKAQLNIGPW